MWCWTEDGLEQPSGMKTATKHKIQKMNSERNKKKQRFLGINKKLFIFPQVFFSKNNGTKTFAEMRQTFSSGIQASMLFYWI